MLYVQFLVSPISTLTNIAERQDLQSIIDSSRAGLIVALFVLTGRAHWPVIPTLEIYSLTMVVSYVGYFLVYARVARTLDRSAQPG
jgi:hypothetical protein